MSAPRTWLALFIGVVVIGGAAPSVAAPSPPHTMDPTALRIVQSAADYLKQQQSFAFTADVMFDDVLPPDFKIQQHAVAQYTMQRPNKLRINYAGDRRQADFYIDGKNFTLYDQNANVYGVLPAGADVQSTLDTIFDKYDFTPPLTDLLANDPFAKFSNVQSGWYVGKSTVRGFSTHHLVFVQKNIDWQIWVDDGQTPLIREVEITYKNLPGQPEYNAIFTDWSFSAANPSVFTFVPPKNAALIDFLTAKAASAGQIK
ncbi:MAG: DUF2092 domain-containing protein [Candidatus Eremiobacteraeota bacterium]|nr:DUF2092 domain-containing protein [Candidatus Eremiobacteraeota bacterium]MBV8339957.1 DUF2092 domain-containing protein [Candidatus Eremiobacteraeota bacterium]MBV8595116.1 DUF2092 domain-containing protein [Candidatus Eremiobacteraeota bacterium]MBV8671574.1 DUF2092 domain-containing protein [Candidatus Eremiobacteraeota bacterium]